MKNLLTATLPALALLALGGCATSGALTTTTESDGVYYSSGDKTTATASQNAVYANRGYAQPQQSVTGAANPDGFAYGRPTNVDGTADDANPDYVAGTGNATEGYDTSTLGASSDYYVSRYSNPSGFGVPYTGPGLSTYDYSPVSSAYVGSPYGYGGFGSPFSYGLGYGGLGYPYGGLYSPYAYSAFYDPFYSSFYSPYSYGLGYGFGLRLGLGFGLGYGYGYPFGGYYGGYPYGYGGGYGYGYSSPAYYRGDNRANVLYGPRGSRGGMVLNAQRNGVAPGGAPVNVGAGRRGAGMVMNANGSNVAPTGATVNNALPQGGGRGAFGNNAFAQPTTAAPGATPNAVPNTTGRRGGFFGGFFGNGANGQVARPSQPQMGGNAGYSQPTRRVYNQPSFSQPSYNQPSRSFSQPSFSQPSRSFGGGSFGGGGGGGGSFGGGGGGGGRRGGR